MSGRLHFGRRGLARAVIVFCVPSTIFMAGHLFYSAYCAFMAGKFTMFDYGVYTNMVWNTSRGDWFRVLVDRSYLHTHLSFSLALLAPLFHVWDNPMLLLVVQWGMVFGGAAFVLVLARRAHVPGDMTAALLFFFFAYRFTQGVVLSQFHGVCAYLLLVPWLYTCCVHRKGTAWLPLALILGLREDAFVLVLPMLLYFAVKDRWKTGYILAAVALLYGVLAIFVLYPSISGISLFERRRHELHLNTSLAFVSGAGLSPRGLALLWTLLPLLIVAHKKSPAVLLFPAPALLCSVLSGFRTQQALGGHYGASVMAYLTVAVLESVSLKTRRGGTVPPRLGMTVRAALLIIVVLAFHFWSGFLIGGGKNIRQYNRPFMQGALAMRMAKRIPKEGMLVTDTRLAGFCANRPDILTWDRYKPERHELDLAFTKASSLHSVLDGALWRMLDQGRVGVYAYDGLFVVLKRGHTSATGREFLDAFPHRPILMVLTRMHAGRNAWDDDGAPVRYWCGTGWKGPITLSFAGYRWLEAGRYDAIFRYRAEAPRKTHKNTWGRFGIHILDEHDRIAQAEIQRSASPRGVYLSQRVPFELATPTNVEIRVTGGDAKLWLESVMFVERGSEN